MFLSPTQIQCQPTPTMFVGLTGANPLLAETGVGILDESGRPLQPDVLLSVRSPVLSAEGGQYFIDWLDDVVPTSFDWEIYQDSIDSGTLAYSGTITGTVVQSNDFFGRPDAPHTAANQFTVIVDSEGLYAAGNFQARVREHGGGTWVSTQIAFVSP
jgi:hypothetical protein